MAALQFQAHANYETWSIDFGSRFITLLNLYIKSLNFFIFIIVLTTPLLLRQNNNNLFYKMGLLYEVFP